MQCPSCDISLKEGSKFCEHCGAALPRICLTCGHANSAQARFCSECGVGLAPSKQAKPPSTGPRPTAPITPTSSAERRQLTIMFCDMVGSSALSTRLDPEEQRDVVSAFHSCCAGEIKRLGGMVAQYLGDGVLGTPGSPRG
jgi:double zinc ribbon protein